MCVNGDGNNAAKSNNLAATKEASDNESKDKNDTLTNDGDDDGIHTNEIQHKIASMNEMSGGNGINNAGGRRKEKRRKTLTWLWILLSVTILFLIAVTSLLFCWKEKKPDGHRGKKTAGSSKAPPVPKDVSSTTPTPAKGSKEKPTSATSNQPEKTPLQPATKEPTGNSDKISKKLPSMTKVGSEESLNRMDHGTKKSSPKT